VHEVGGGAGEQHHHEARSSSTSRTSVDTMSSPRDQDPGWPGCGMDGGAWALASRPDGPDRTASG
jgi:hypothetical protein